MRIVGDYHTHTKYSDGTASALQLAVSAREKGIAEIAITDHAYGKFFGFRRKDFDAARAEFLEAKKQMQETAGPNMLFGFESNVIGTNGKIDVDEGLHGELDILVLGYHMLCKFEPWMFISFIIPNLFYTAIRFCPKRRIRKNTEVLKRALEKNKVDILSHPGLYFKIDFVEIAKTCAERGTLLELSGKRINFRPIDFERMCKTGAKFIINSDAHNDRAIGEVDRVTEFLKNCDFETTDIVNLTQTFTEYKRGK